MAPTQSPPWLDAAKRSAIAAVPEITRASAHIMLSRRALTVDDTQKVTLGVCTIRVYGLSAKGGRGGEDQRGRPKI